MAAQLGGAMRIRKRFKAEMAHKVPGAYTTRCHHLHGHSYRFDVTVASERADSAHMALDFRHLKTGGVGNFLDGFDHAVVLWEGDELVARIDEMNPNRHLIVPFLPTAEMIAKACFEVCSLIVDTLPGSARVVAVAVHETETSTAEYGIEDVGDDFPDVATQNWTVGREIAAQWAGEAWAQTLFPQLAH